mgnify:CR=1 FL=1
MYPANENLNHPASQTKSEEGAFVPAVSRDLLVEWYRLAYLSRQLDDRASKYIRRSMGWSYHARCSGHEAIQIAMGLS